MAPGHARVAFDEAAFGEDVMRSGRAGGLGLRHLAFGVRHHPKGSHAETVYEIAHRRLHG